MYLNMLLELSHVLLSLALCFTIGDEPCNLGLLSLGQVGMLAAKVTYQFSQLFLTLGMIFGLENLAVDHGKVRVFPISHCPVEEAVPIGAVMERERENDISDE